jgi:hypothetical protein
MIVEIKAALEAMKQTVALDNVAMNNALNDCLALSEPRNKTVTPLESHFDSCLWFADEVGFDEAYPTDEDKAYAIALSSIEEILVEKALIYND